MIGSHDQLKEGKPIPGAVLVPGGKSGQGWLSQIWTALIGVLRGNVEQVGGAPLTLGQKVADESVPVVIAVNQSPVPITGGVTILGPVTVLSSANGQTDKTAFTPGTTLEQPVGGFVSDVAPDTVPELMTGAFRMTPKRAEHVNLRDNAGAEFGTAANPLFTALPTGALANGAEVAVGAAAVQLLAANASRKVAFIQNTGVASARIGTTGVTATTGLRVSAGATLILEMPFVPTNAIFAIREGAVSTTVLGQEIT